MPRKSPEARPTRPKKQKLRIIYTDDPEFETLFKESKVLVGGPLQPEVPAAPEVPRHPGTTNAKKRKRD